MRIEHLALKTSRLEEQRHFYGEILGMEIREVSLTSFEVQLELSVLRFTQSAQATPYHIAFHIGASQQHKALDWLKQRVDILQDQEKEIIDFSSWNAKSIYFYDPDKNVLEFISRRHLYPTKEDAFAGRSVLGISEIGLATDNVLESYTFLNKEFDLVKFTGDYDTFCATGDDHGLFIIADTTKKTWFPSADQVIPADFDIRFTTSQLRARFQYEAGTLQRLKL